MTGPAAAAIEPAALQMPIAMVRRSGAVPCSTMPSEAGIMPAAPAPCTARAAMRASIDGATAQASDAAVNRSTEMTNSLRRPSTSASRPAEVSRAAKSTAYALTTQERVDTEVSGKSSASAGKATLTTVASRNARKVAPDVIINRVDGLTGVMAAEPVVCAKVRAPHQLVRDRGHDWVLLLRNSIPSVCRESSRGTRIRTVGMSAWSAYGSRVSLPRPADPHMPHADMAEGRPPGGG